MPDAQPAPARMRLYVSSAGIPDPAAFEGLFATRLPRKIALIANAWDNAPPEKSEPFVARASQQLKGLGFAVQPLDLRDYRGRSAELRTGLQDSAGVWVTGGNTFYLNWLIGETGFAVVLRQLLEQGFVYGGESAGAVVAGTTLHGVEALDNILEAPVTLWDGMGLVPYGIVPHWGEAAYALYLEQCYKEMTTFSPVKVLTSAQHIVVNEEPND